MSIYWNNLILSHSNFLGNKIALGVESESYKNKGSSFQES